ncbi:hypothetical protein [Burkholderia cenocepacia]|uniref:hypothetical protein n=1 Tax=Burkholderia cenocepacia TaxID=95486 RepID=UPI0011B3FC9A|nr:hypothetical protein [Burkholderia cenocepacia]
MKNVVGSGERSCGCGSWLDHWVKFTTHRDGDHLCSVDGCTELAVDGAHVTLPHLDVEDERQLHWIIPMCRRHNKSPDQLLSKPEVRVVSANIGKTCKK